MSPRLFDEWRSEWRLKRGLGAYVASIMSEPDADDVAWLAEAACGGDLDRAAWELRYACLLYTSPSPRDRTRSRMPSSA